MADPDSRAGARYATPETLQFVEQLHAPHDDALRLAYESPAREGLPPISLAPSEGKLLELLVRLIGARRCVEIGALAGYSAMRIARALPDGGRLWSCEHDPRAVAVTRANLAAAKLDGKVEVVAGRAVDTLPSIAPHGPFDLVFVDADKESYPLYARWAADHLRQGGLLLCDNAYLFGQLMDEGPTPAALRECHRFVAERFDSVCIPTPDGMLVGIRR